MSARATVAVAGGSGFIGRNVVAALRQRGLRVVVLARHAHATEPRDGVELRAADVAAAPPDLSGCDAVVNLVGIKAPSGANSFARAHIDAVTNLVAAMREAAITRLVHVSVVALPPTLSEYARTKAAGERIAEQSGLEVTIIRPALVVGEGDDATTSLVRFVRMAPVFPVSAGKPGPLSPVDVRDVAAAIVACIDTPSTIGKTIDVVGPERLDLRVLVRRVARALELPTLLLPVPAFTQRWAAALMERLPGNPVVTRSQLAMLDYGLTGDPNEAAAHLDLAPRGLDEARIRELAHAVGPWPSLRIVPTAAHREWIETRGAASPSLRWFVPLALLAMLLAPSLIANIWLRMAAVDGALLALALWAMPTLRWRSLLAPTARNVVWGLGAAAALYLVCLAGFALLSAATPALAAGSAAIYSWPNTLPIAAQLPLLLLTVVAEDAVWRAGIGLPIAARAGPAVGILAGATLFAVAHITSGPPLLVLAAFCCGAFWTAILFRTQSLTAAIVSHLVFDVVALYVLPLA